LAAGNGLTGRREATEIMMTVLSTTARDAKTREAEEFNRGHLSSAERARIDRKADEILGRDPGDRPRRASGNR
jgi:hypothetical protein